uniref:cAMP regulated phosphoprotein 19 n=1 Tax=Amphiprion percula TaxID=161767 RepID=A0A3P8U7X5_AMPPE
MSEEVEGTRTLDEQQEMEDKVISPEKAEEAKLKARYPNLAPKHGGSDFLRKRLQKGVCFSFILGNLLKNSQLLGSCSNSHCVVSLFVQQKYFDSGDYNMAKAKMKNKQLPSAPTEKTEITGDHIPTPQDLPQRKTSIVASKLAG